MRMMLVSSHYRLGGKQEYEMSVLQNLKKPVRLQCKRSGREWLHAGDAAVSGRTMARIPIGRGAHSVEQRL